MIRNHLSQLLGRSHAMSVIVAAGIPGEEPSAISLAVSSKRVVRIMEQSVAGLPTAVVLPIRTWNQDRQGAFESGA
jgi:hypothetical protein